MGCNFSTDSVRTYRPLASRSRGTSSTSVSVDIHHMPIKQNRQRSYAYRDSFDEDGYGTEHMTAAQFYKCRVRRESSVSASSGPNDQQSHNSNSRNGSLDHSTLGNSYFHAVYRTPEKRKQKPGAYRDLDTRCYNSSPSPAAIIEAVFDSEPLHHPGLQQSNDNDLLQ